MMMMTMGGGGGERGGEGAYVRVLMVMGWVVGFDAGRGDECAGETGVVGSCGKGGWRFRARGRSCWWMLVGVGLEGPGAV